MVKLGLLVERRVPTAAAASAAINGWTLTPSQSSSNHLCPENE